jgi:hypothetical protein
MRLVQRHAQIPYRAVAFAARTLAVRVAASQIALHQGSAQHFSERGQESGQALATIPQGEFGESGKFLSFRHLAARIIQPNRKNANANLANANFPFILLSYLNINPACEVPELGRPFGPASPIVLSRREK